MVAGKSVEPQRSAFSVERVSSCDDSSHKVTMKRPYLRPATDLPKTFRSDTSPRSRVHREASKQVLIEVSSHKGRSDAGDLVARVPPRKRESPRSNPPLRSVDTGPFRTVRPLAKGVRRTCKRRSCACELACGRPAGRPNLLDEAVARQRRPRSHT